VTAEDCPSCADERAAGAAFCEACGKQLREPTPGAGAGAGTDDASDAGTGGAGGGGTGAADAGRTDAGGVAGASNAGSTGTGTGHGVDAGRPASSSTGTSGAAGTGGAADAGEGRPRPCPHCGAADAVGADGYCGNCGMLAGRPRDHIEISVGAIGAAVTDRGLRHHRNEDAVWLVARGTDVDVVVCDGVSSSFDPDVASATAAEVAGGLLAGAGDDLPKQVTLAIEAAAAAVAALATTGDPRRAVSNPACTIVAAGVRGAEIGYGWTGDSRAYWIGAAGTGEQLTEDDSWATHAIALGASPQAALNDPKAHAITAWLGADAGPSVPRTGKFTVTTAGHLVICSDGLWNYLTDPATFADTVRTHLLEAGGDPLAAARTLIAFANEAGGADNITVALIPVDH
jgi:serine/threonine protein phosphatase PrpC